MIINDSRINKKLKDNSIDKNNIKKAIVAFISGGLIGVLGQLLYYLFFNIFNINENDSSLFTSAFFILIAFTLTCIGVFDKLINYAYCGLIIPITGFANSITSSALEGKSEGMIFGIGSKMFSLIGSVITYGIISSIFLGIIYFIIGLF